MLQRLNTIYFSFMLRLAHCVWITEAAFPLHVKVMLGLRNVKIEKLSLLFHLASAR